MNGVAVVDELLAGESGTERRIEAMENKGQNCIGRLCCRY